MKKKLCSLLVALCMVLGLMPGTALADWEAPTYTYDQLVAKIARDASKSYPDPIEFIPAADFGWPEEATLTIPARIQLAPAAAWEIPYGTTVYFETNARGIAGTEVIVNGTMKTAYSSQDAIFDGCKKIVIGPGANFVCEPRANGYVPTPNIHVREGTTLKVLDGADLNARVRLYGTLTGEGTVSQSVTINGGYNGENTNAVISGELTFVQGQIQVGSSFGEYADTLTIPAGSHLKFDQGASLSVESAEAVVDLEGKLELLEGTDPEWDSSCFISFREAGKLVMTAGSEIILRAPSEFGQNAVGWEEEESFSAATQDQFPRFVEGTGTIKFYGDEAWYGFFHSSADQVVRYLERDDWMIPVERYVDFTNITLWRSWNCTHVFEEGEVLKQPTCTEPGEVEAVCVYCGTSSPQPIAPTGHTAEEIPAVEPTLTTVGYTAGTECAVCGEHLSGGDMIPALFAEIAPVVKEDKVIVQMKPEQEFTLLCAFYDEDGRFCWGQARAAAPDQQEAVFDISEGSSTYALFLLDGNWKPLCENYNAAL